MQRWQDLRSRLQSVIRADQKEAGKLKGLRRQDGPISLFHRGARQIDLLYRGVAWRVAGSRRALLFGAAAICAQRSMMLLSLAFCTASAASLTETHLMSR